MNHRRLMKGLHAFVFLMLATSAQAVVVNSFDNGWYQEDGTHDTTNKNILTGYRYLDEFKIGVTNRNFFVFDLSAYAGMVVTSATFTIPSVGNYVTADSSETYSLYDYSGSIADLIGGTGGVAAFNDLGGGTSFGSNVVDTSGPNFSATPNVTISLAAAALTDINTLLGGSSFDYALGGACTTCVVGTASQYLWGSSTSAFGQLTLEFESSVPVPAPLILIGLGLAALGYRRRKLN